MKEEYLEYEINDVKRLSLLGENSEKVLENIIENLTVAICLFRIVDNQRIEALYLSDEYFHIIGFSKEDYAENVYNVTTTISKKDVDRILEKARESIINHKEFDDICRRVKCDKSIAWFRIKGFPIEYTDEKWPVFLASINEVTGEMKEFENLKELKKIKDELEIERQRYRILEETVEALLFEYIPSEDIMIFSYNFPGNHERKIINNYLEIFEKNPLVHKMHIKMFKETLLHACKVCTKDKIEYLSEVSGRGYQWHRTYYSSVTDKSGRIISVMGRIYNINDEIIENSKRNGSLVVDSLTGAYIREEGYARIDKFLKENHNIESYLVMVDMDNFKMINDNFGHRTGDLVLKKLTQKVIELLDKNGIIIRFGGDEFIIFAHDITSGELYLRIETLRKYADDILEDGKVSAEFSVGITSCGNKTLTEMFDDADKRMYS